MDNGLKKRTSVLAIVSLIIAILSIPLCFTILLPVTGIITGSVARSKIRKSSAPLKGKGLATAGMGLSVFSVLLGFAVIIIPNIMSFHRRPPQVEARATLLNVYEAQMQYEAQHGRFGNIEEINYEHLGYCYTIFFSSEDMILPHPMQKAGSQSPVITELPEDIEAFVTDTNFKIVAAGKVKKIVLFGRNEWNLDVWVINESRELTNLINGIR